MMNTRILLALGFAAAFSLSAQQGVIQEGIIHDILVAAPEGASAATPAVQFFSVGDGMGATVKGQPYSAEATTEMVRVLADGTRVVNKNTSTLARDKEGRTRRENTLANIGPWATAGSQPPRFVTISDPVAKEMHMLDLNARTARKIKGGSAAFANLHPAAATENSETFERKIEIVTRDQKGESAAASPGVMLPPIAMGSFHRFDTKSGKRENLGRQNMEGVMVEGTRETMTIAAGEIGNDRPIVSTTERWYSPELQMEILTKTIDPQFGESSYRVTNLRRNEPNADLFRVPADFKVVQEGPGVIPSRRWVTKEVSKEKE